MTIPPKSLPKYLHSIDFPVNILAETGDVIARTVTRPELQALIDTGSVIGIGSWKRIRKFRMNIAVSSIRRMPPGEDPLDVGLAGRIANSHRYTYNENLPMAGTRITMLKRYIAKSGEFVRW